MPGEPESRLHRFSPTLRECRPKGACDQSAYQAPVCYPVAPAFTWPIRCHETRVRKLVPACGTVRLPHNCRAVPASVPRNCCTGQADWCRRSPTPCFGANRQYLARTLESLVCLAQIGQVYLCVDHQELGREVVPLGAGFIFLTDGLGVVGQQQPASRPSSEAVHPPIFQNPARMPTSLPRQNAQQGAV